MNHWQRMEQKKRMEEKKRFDERIQRQKQVGLQEEGHYQAYPGQYILRPVNEPVLLSNVGWYQIGKFLSRGSFGNVYSARDTFDQPRALKIFKTGNHYNKQCHREHYMLQELQFYGLETFFPLFYDTFNYSGHSILCTEFLGPSLQEILNDNGAFSLHQTQLLVYQLCCAISKLADLQIMHCDLRPANIVLKYAASESTPIPPMIIKIIDFNSAIYYDELKSPEVLAKHPICHHWYKPLEVCLGNPVPDKADIFSVGCLGIEFYTGRVQFRGHNDTLMHLNHLNKFYRGFPQSVIVGEKVQQYFYFQFNTGRYELKFIPRKYQYCCDGIHEPTVANFDILVCCARDIRESYPSGSLHTSTELNGFIDLLRNMMDLNVADRWTASDVIAKYFMPMYISNPSFFPIGIVQPNNAVRRVHRIPQFNTVQ